MILGKESQITKGTYIYIKFKNFNHKIQGNNKNSIHSICDFFFSSRRENLWRFLSLDQILKNEKNIYSILCKNLLSLTQGQGINQSINLRFYKKNLWKSDLSLNYKAKFSFLLLYIVAWNSDFITWVERTNQTYHLLVLVIVKGHSLLTSGFFLD